MNKIKKRNISPKVIIICSFWMTIGLSSFGQNQITDQQHSWYMLAASHKFSDHWGATTLFDWRREGVGATWQQSLLRIGADYRLTQGPILSVGYDWLQNFQYGEQPIPYGFNENRIYEQFILKQKVGKILLDHRYRFEQRFLGRKFMDETGFYVKDEYAFWQRTRYRLSATLPWTKKEMKKGCIFSSASDEVFINFGQGIDKNVLDQNWFTAGIGYMITDKAKLFAGYLNQFVIKGDGIHQERNHTLRIAFSKSIYWQRTSS